MGIGLNSGHVMSGNVGSEQRVEYAAVGDTTNSASRLESLTKGTPHQLMVSGATKEALTTQPDDLAFVDEIELRGRRTEIAIWALAEEPEGPAASRSRRSISLGRMGRSSCQPTTLLRACRGSLRPPISRKPCSRPAAGP